MPVIFQSGKNPLCGNFFGGSRVIFVRSASQVLPDDTLAVWGRKPVSGKLPPEGVQLIRLEDGFLRSVGLCADLVRPMSWVIDTCGICYDATQPSGLDVLLQTTEFTPEIAGSGAKASGARGKRRTYQVQRGQQRLAKAAGSRRVILVPGQVESYASLWRAWYMHESGLVATGSRAESRCIFSV